MERGQPAAGLGAVHDVVLDQGEEVKQLEGGGDPREVGVGSVGRAGEDPAPVGQPRASRLPWLASRSPSSPTRSTSSGPGTASREVPASVKRGAEPVEGDVEQGVHGREGALDRRVETALVETAGARLGTHRSNSVRRPLSGAPVNQSRRVWTIRP